MKKNGEKKGAGGFKLEDTAGRFHFGGESTGKQSDFYDRIISQ